MNQLRFIIMAVLLVTSAGIATSQEASSATDLRRDLRSARAEVTAVARELHSDLVALVPPVPGWSCHEAEESEDKTWLDPVPIARFDCQHSEQSLSLTLLFDPSSASAICRSIAYRQEGIADGRIAPDLFRFFEGGAWQIARASVDLEGCAADVVVLKAKGARSEAAIAQGPAAIDAFARAVLTSDPGDLADKASAHTAALNRLLELLDAQSRLLANHIPAPAGAIREIRLPSSAAASGLPLPMILGFSPSVTADLEVEGCSLHIELSSAPITIHEAKTTGLRWAAPGGKDGTIRGAFIRRNTDRLTGQERVDGTGIEVLVDQAIIVRIVIPGNHVCDGDPEIVHRLLEEILASDPAKAVAP